MAKLISVGQIIDQSWSHYTKHFQQLMKISLWWFVIPLLILVANLIAPVGQVAYLVDSGTITVGDIIAAIIYIVANGIVAPIIGVWIAITLLKAIDKQANKKSFDVTKEGKASWKLFFPYVWVAILKSLVIFLCLTPIIPGFALILLTLATKGGAVLGATSIVLMFIGLLVSLVLVVKYGLELAFAEYGLVLNDARGRKALADSRKIVKGRFWSVLVRLLIPTALFTVIVVLVQYLLIFVYALALGSLANLGTLAVVRIDTVVQALISTGVAAVSTPLFLIVGYVIYDSLRKN